MESYWKKSINEKIRFEPINGNIETDVCIIGAGITGISTAYKLRGKKNIVILEKDEICSGSSGRNTGKLTSQHGLFYNYLIESNGKVYAKKYFEANEKAIDEIEKIIDKENIECEFERVNSYVFSRSNKDKEEFLAEKNAIDKIDKDKSKMLNELDINISVESAIEFFNEAQFNPVKYVYGLVNTIIKYDVQIFEHSKVTEVKKIGDKYEILANNNKVIAKDVVIATRYPIINFPGYYFIKMYQSTSFAMVIDPQDEIFDGIYISNDLPKISFRVIKDGEKNLLLIVGYDYKTGEEQITNMFECLEKYVKNIYPNANVIYKWTAEDCISLDKIPYIGEYSNFMKNVYVATGFNKWGLTTSNIASNIISDKIMGKENEYEEIYKSTRLEPIKNKDEMKNMIEEVKDSIVLSKFKIPKDNLSDVKIGEGKIIEFNGHKVGVYKDENGKMFAVKPICTHLGCELYFNNSELIWECSCHGSKFTYDGISIEAPSIKDLEKYFIK